MHKITNQALLVAIFGFLVVISLLISAPKLWLVALSIGLGFLVAAYTVNCTIHGKCYIWAWALTIIYLVNALSLLVVAFSDKKKLLKTIMPKN